MSEDFDFLRNTQDEPEELPDWLEEATVAPPFVDEDVDDSSVEDAFERLRQQAAMAASDLDDELEGKGRRSGSGFFSQISPGQRLILAVLLLLNVLIITFAILIVTGTLTF